MYFNRIRNQYICDMPEPTASKNKLSGTINEADTGDRSIWAYDRNDGELLGSTLIDRTTRQWELYIDPAHSDESITLICRDESGKYNGDIFDRVSLCRTEYPYPAGLMSMLSYPEDTLLSVHASPDYFNKFCTIEVPELKGNIAKVVQNGAQVDKAYPVKFVDSAGTEVQNSVTSNNVILNDDSVVLNKLTRAPNLVSWKKNIFNDGSEIFHPVWNGKSWSNFYGNQPFEITCNAQPDDIENNCTTGKFYEAALLVEEKQGDNALTGMNCKIDTKNVQNVSVSFWYRSTGSADSQSLSGGYPETDIIGFTDASKLAESTLFRLGIIYVRYSWNNFYSPKTCTFSASTATTNKNMPGNFTFGDWHHFVITQQGTSLKLYIDKTLACTLNQPGLSIKDLSCIRFGRGLDVSSQYTNCITGIYSGVRVFKKVVSTAEIAQLYDDTPSAEKVVSSIKGMEYDGGMLCLGGVPYTSLTPPVVKTVQYADGTRYRIVQGWTSSSASRFTGELEADYIRFAGENQGSQGYYTALSSRPDTNATTEMGLNLNNIDVYLRVYLENTGYIFKIGNKTNSIHLYWYANDYGMTYRYRNAAGVDSGNMYIRAETRPAFIQNKWIRIKWIQDRILIYEDDGTTIICNYTIPNYSMVSETKGQISVGCQRGGSMSDPYPPDAYGGTFRISDFHIYEKGKIGIDQPLKKYEFGINRDVFGGLYLMTAHNIYSVPAEIDSGDIQELNALYELGADNVQMPSWDNNTPYTDRGFTFLAHTQLYKYPALSSTFRSLYFGDGIWTWGMTERPVQVYCNYYRKKPGTGGNERLAGSIFRSAQLREWNHVGFTFNPEDNKACLYAQGIPVNSVVDYLLAPFIQSYASTLRIDKDACLAYSNLNFYPVVLSTNCIRNAFQNYLNKCYKDEMLVAFMDENTDYPVYMNTPISRIYVQGKDNGQILTFACTKNGTDYYIYTTEWKKILTKEGNNWKYFDGAAWQDGGTVKWKAASLAMDVPQNRMTLQKINSLTAVQINTFHDLNVGTLNLAIGMKSDGTSSPYIERIAYNDEKVYLSPVVNLADFDQTKYITKMFLSKVLVENKTDGIKLYVHKSGELGWQECQNFTEVPGIIKNSANTGTVQFKIVSDQRKDNKSEPALLRITIK